MESIQKPKLSLCRHAPPPADETPSAPCDAQPDELDIAIRTDHIAKATTLEIRHIRAKWAGLRSFVRDGEPVTGFNATRLAPARLRRSRGRRGDDADAAIARRVKEAGGAPGVAGRTGLLDQ